MTPKEKALELVDKLENHSFIDIDKKISSYSSAKECALITVNEILKSIPCNQDYGGDGWVLIDNTEYWQEVKQEIEKL